MDGRKPLLRDRACKHQIRHRVQITRVAGHAGVRLRRFGFPKRPFGGFDRAHDRRDPLRIPVDADAEIKLPITGVVLELLDQLDDLVGRAGFEPV